MDSRVNMEIDSIEVMKEEKVSIVTILQGVTNNSTKVPRTQWDLKFFYPPHQQKILEEKIAEFKDKLYTSYKTYTLDENENVFYMRTQGISKDEKTTKKLITEILKDDNGAILNTTIDDPTLAQLCKFKMKVMIKKNVGNHVKFSCKDLMEDDD